MRGRLVRLGLAAALASLAACTGDGYGESPYYGYAQRPAWGYSPGYYGPQPYAAGYRPSYPTYGPQYAYGGSPGITLIANFPQGTVP